MQAAVAASGRGRGARMLAWRLHAYGTGTGTGTEPAAELRLEEARVPPLRSPTEVLVRVRAASINPLDVAMIGGYGSRILNALRAAEGAEGAEGVEFPLVLGRDFVGVVERAGAGVGPRVRVGQRVWGAVPPHRAGSHAQYVAVEASCVGAAPAGVGDAAAAGAPYAALSACAALRAAGLPPGERRPGPAPRVLLLGLGGVGHAALQLLVHGGAQVTVGCAGDERDEAAALGAAATLDRHAAGYSSALEAGGPYAAILDCAGLGGEEAARRAWVFERYVTLSSPLLRHTDALGLAVGGARSAAELVRQGGAVRWAFFSARAEDLETVRRLTEAGRLRVRVEQAWGWREAAAGYARAAAGSARGKLIIDFEH